MNKTAYIEQTRSKVTQWYRLTKELKAMAKDQYNALGGVTFVAGGFTGSDITEQQFVDGIAGIQAVASTSLEANETNISRLLV